MRHPSPDQHNGGPASFAATSLYPRGPGTVPAAIAGALLLGLVFNAPNFESGRGTVSPIVYMRTVICGGVLVLVNLFLTRLSSFNQKVSQSR